MNTQTSLIPLFCYGSNGIEQVRRRVNNYSLKSYKCELPFYRRIFAGRSSGWQNGGVASIIHVDDPKVSCRGTCVFLSEEEMKKMDKFEGIVSNNPYDKNPYVNVYSRENVKIKTSNGTILDGIAYVKNDNNWLAYPSNDYLNACYKNIYLFWKDLDGNNTIMIYDNKGVERGRYRH